MAKGGSGSSAPAGGAATFRLVEGATLTLPDGCTATVRQGALELSDGQRLPLPEAGGSVTIERRVVRPDGRAALMRHTIRVGEPTDTKLAKEPLPAGEAPAEVPEKTSAGMAGDVPKGTPTEVLEEAEVGVSEEAPEEAPAKVPVEVADKALVEVVVKEPDVVQDEVLENVPADVQNQVSPEVSAEVPANVPAEEPAESPVELSAKVTEKVQEEVSDEVQSEEPTETAVAVSLETPAGISTEVPSEIQLEPAEVPARVSTEDEFEVNSKKLAETSVEVADNALAEKPTDVPSDHDVDSSGLAAVEEKTTLVSASLGSPLLSSTLEGSDGLSSALEDARPRTTAADGEGSDESRYEDLQRTDAPSPVKQSSTSAVKFHPSLSPSLATKGSLSPVAEDSEPPFENVKLPADSKPYCEWTEHESVKISSKSNVPASGIESVKDALRREENESQSPVEEEDEEDEDTEPVVKSRLAHHDSLRLPIHVPRLRKRSDGHDVPTDTHSPCSKKVAAYLNDPQRKHEEDEEMRTKLNSILHKLGYGVPDNTGDGDKDHTAKDPSGSDVARTQQPEPLHQAAESPKEPEPISVPKVISFFESITPQRAESPVERRKWRSSDRSPSALRSPRSAVSPEPPRDHGPLQNKQSPSPRRVNFADSAQRVFISSTTERDEMEDIPIPRQEESSFSSPELVQTCLKQLKPVITTQPTRLTAILVQNSPDKTLEDSKAAEETAGTSAAVAGDSPQKNESSELPEGGLLSSSVLEVEEPPPQSSQNNTTPVKTDRTKQSEPEHAKEQTVTQSRTGTNKESEDVLDSSEATPLIFPSTAEELSQVPATEGSSNGAVAPIQAESLARPSSVIIQGDLPPSDFPTMRTVVPTELPDGTGPVLVTAEMAEEAAGTEPNDPFLPDESAQHRNAAGKPSTSWFEDCMEICCCFLVP